MAFIKTCLLFLFATTTILTGCQASKKSPSDSSKYLYQHWIHSHEEDLEDIKTYRPASFDFPPSRGRVGMEFKPNGSYIEHKIGANDAPVAVLGKYSKNNQGNFILTPDDKSKKTREFQLIELNKDFIKIKWAIVN